MYLSLFSLAHAVNKGRNHIKAFANKSAKREIKYVVEDPSRRHVRYLEITNMTGITLVHKHAHNDKCREGKSHEEYLPRCMIENDRENKAECVRKLN